MGEGATPFPGLLHFTLAPYRIILSVKQSSIKYNFWVHGMTRPGIEPRSPELLENTLLIRTMAGWYAIKQKKKKKKKKNKKSKNKDIKLQINYFLTSQ